LTNSNPTQDLKSALQKLGAREFEIAALSLDPHRGLGALALAQAKGVDRPISYAIKLFDSADWQPSGEKRRQVVNASVDVKCAVCAGDRFVAVLDDPTTLYAETYKPCPKCNASVDCSFYRADGSRFVVAK
jgi:hypothetical protein